MKVAVFGGSAPRPGDEVYAQAVELGRLLAMGGHTVMTGGYMGVMEAASRGANEAGGHVIGVTCNEIERWRNSRATVRGLAAVSRGLGEAMSGDDLLLVDIVLPIAPPEPRDLIPAVPPVLAQRVGAHRGERVAVDYPADLG